jgi:hypothetical protein
MANKDEKIKTRIAILLKSIDLSRLKVTALDSNKENNEVITNKSTQIRTEKVKFEASNFTVKLCSLNESLTKRDWSKQKR